MRWEDYRDIYNSYQLSVNQTRVLTLVAIETFKDYPRRLPDSIRQGFAETVAQVVERAAHVASMAESKGVVEEARLHVELETPSHEVVMPLLIIAILHGFLGIDISLAELNFERAACSQELVMVYAHLDAFMCDSLAAICRLRPDVMKSTKQMEWARILSYDGWEEMLGHMIEEYVFQFGWQTVSKRVEWLRQRIGLPIDYEDADLVFVDEAEKVRNIVVHNAGRVSEEYIRKTGDTKLPVGELVPLTLEYTEKAFYATQALAGRLFIGVSEKFFGKTEESSTARVIIY